MPAYNLATPTLEDSLTLRYQSSHSLINLAVNLNRGCFRHCPAIHLVADSEYRIQREASLGIAKVLIGESYGENFPVLTLLS